MFRCDLRLDAAPRPAIARNDDAAFHGNSHPVELLVIVRNAVVDIDQRRGDVAVDGISVVCWKLFVNLVRCRILGESRFLQLGDKFCRSDKFYGAFFWGREENIKCLNVCIEPPLGKLGEDPFRVFFVVRRSEMVRMGGELFHVLTQVLRFRNRAKLFFPFTLGLRK